MAGLQTHRLSLCIDDHLGSTVGTTKTSGNETFTYRAFGDSRSGTSPTTERQYTGQKQDDNQLMYYNARYYDKYLGAFISPDTVIPDPTDIASYNRYAYANGNPIKYNDPTGYDPLDQNWVQEFKLQHDRNPEWYDETIRLFSIAYPGEWNESQFYDSAGNLNEEEFWSVFWGPPKERSWDTLGQALVSMAGWYQAGEEALFIQDIGILFGGLETRSQGEGSRTPYWLKGTTNNPNVRINPGSLAERYYMNPPGSEHLQDGDANVHHWAWALSIGYNTGSGMAINTIREVVGLGQRPTGQINWADVRIGNAGSAMGVKLRFSGDMRSIPNLLADFLGVHP